MSGWGLKLRICCFFCFCGWYSHKATYLLLFGSKAINVLLTVEKAIHMVTVMSSLLQQIKKRRLTLGLKQSDMRLRVGISRQQYQRLEAKGNPRLDTLELIAKGLNSELMLIPQEKLSAVMAVIEQDSSGPNRRYEATTQKTSVSTDDVKKSLSDDPWQGLLGDN